jgi:Uma2 family endonuclease
VDYYAITNHAKHASTDPQPAGPSRSADILVLVATVVPHPQVQHSRLEPSQYIALQADAGWCLPIEYIYGEAIVMPPTTDTASAVRGALFFALADWQDHAIDPGIARQNVFVSFPRDEHLAPDISWWRSGRRSPVVHGEVTVIPDLVVEILSPATRANDLGPKRNIYLRSGVKELWLVDPHVRVITRVRPNTEDQLLIATHELTTDLLDGLSVDLKRVF